MPFVLPALQGLAILFMSRNTDLYAYLDMHNVSTLLTVCTPDSNFVDILFRQQNTASCRKTSLVALLIYDFARKEMREGFSVMSLSRGHVKSHI